jgi:hypothetical protein
MHEAIASQGEVFPADPEDTLEDPMTPGMTPRRPRTRTRSAQTDPIEVHGSDT